MNGLPECNRLTVTLTPASLRACSASTRRPLYYVKSQGEPTGKKCNLKNPVWNQSTIRGR